MSALFEAHYARIVANLIAGDVQARVVHGAEYVGIQIRSESKSIVWANTLGTWGWTAVDLLTGEATSGYSMISSAASADDVALGIVMMYSDPTEGPTL